MTNIHKVQPTQDISGNYHEEIWRRVSIDLYNQFGENLYKNWFAKLNFAGNLKDHVILSAPTNFIRDWIKTNYYNTIQGSWQHYDHNIKTIEFITKLSTEETDASSSNAYIAPQNVIPEKETPIAEIVDEGVFFTSGSKIHF